jgi:hypothetical protein
MFAALGFVVGLGITRGITTWLHHHDAGASGGILVDRQLWFRLTAFGYGVCSALILDEFALWLSLRDVYWQHLGRASVEALAAAGGRNRRGRTSPSLTRPRSGL